MRILLATGIYPPDIGGPATYVRALAREFVRRGHGVTVVTYREGGEQQEQGSQTTNWGVVQVARNGGPLVRWMRYAKALKVHGSDADMVIAFSSVSAGAPLWFAKLERPKKILRLGGDFLWERYTDRGGRQTLREFYEYLPIVYSFLRLFVARLLHQFDRIVFSTKFQEELYEQHYRGLPPHSVIENSLPTTNYKLQTHAKHVPFRLLFAGRFVGFKNLPVLLEAVSSLQLASKVTLTLVGDGPFLKRLRLQTTNYKLHTQFLPPVHGEDLQKIFAEHDLLVLPSLTEISPNVALEARAAGLPILLTQETGLSAALQQGMVVRNLSTPTHIVEAVEDVMERYDEIAAEAAAPPLTRSWSDLASEYLSLFASL